MLRKFLIALAALALLAAPLDAQQASRGFTPDVNGSSTFNCTGSSSANSLPGTGAIVLVQNISNNEMFIALGGATVVAVQPGTATNGTPLLPNTAIFLSTAQATTIACISPNGGFFRVTTGTGNPNAISQISNTTVSSNIIPLNAVQLSNAATGTTAAVAATLPGAAGVLTYVCGFSWSPGSATAAITSTLTIATLVNGQTFTYVAGAPVTAAGVTGTTIQQTFTPCLGANSTNTAITATASALGAGGINNDVQIWGFRQ